MHVPFGVHQEIKKGPNVCSFVYDSVHTFVVSSVILKEKCSKIKRIGSVLRR